MVTTGNYFMQINQVDISSLPHTLAKSHDFVTKSTQNGKTWDDYNNNPTIRRVIDLYLQRLNEFLSSQSEIRKVTSSSNEVDKPIKALKVPKQKEKLINTKRRPNALVRKIKPNSKKVEHVREEIKFIKRFVGLHNKVKTANAILSFVKSLQKSIVQKLICKTSPLAKEIRYIQDHLIDAYNKMKGDTKFSISEKELAKLVVISGGEEVYPSINIIKRYIGMQGKEIDGNKIGLFIKAIESALKRDKVKEGDPYQDKVKAILNSLKKLKTGQKPSIGKAELNGLEGIVKACGCKPDLGKIYDTKGKSLRQCKKKTYSDARKGACSHHKGLSGILTAEEIATREFELLNFNYRWSSLLGKPAKNSMGSSGLNSEYVSEGVCRYTSKKYSAYFGVSGMIGFIVESIDINKNVTVINHLLMNSFKESKTTQELKYYQIEPDFDYSYCSTHIIEKSSVTIYHLMLDFSKNIE